MRVSKRDYIITTRRIAEFSRILGKGKSKSSPLMPSAAGTSLLPKRELTQGVGTSWTLNLVWTGRAGSFGERILGTVKIETFLGQ